VLYCKVVVFVPLPGLGSVEKVQLANRDLSIVLFLESSQLRVELLGMCCKQTR